MQLSPWLRMDSPAVLHWQRGDKRKGESKAVMPIPMGIPSATEGDLEGPEAYKIIFEEVFVVSNAANGYTNSLQSSHCVLHTTVPRQGHIQAQSA